MQLLSLCPLLLVTYATASPALPAATPVLKTAAGSRYFGAALAQGHITNASDTMFATLAAAEFSGATPENEMKWDATEPNQNQFTFAAGDSIRDFAQSHGFKLRGHTLVWHSQLPAFVNSLTGNNLLNAMTNHINTVMTHYKGQIFAWDVVNEAFNDDGTLGASPFLTQLGSNYIQTAFQIARKADPGARLYINDFNTEGVNAKSNALLQLVQSLKSQNLIDGVGFQSHFIVGEVPSDLQTNLQRFANAGVEVALTELDIRTTVPVSSSALAQHPIDFANVVRACISVSNCVGITTWGITDRYSWIPGTFPGQSFGLLWDDNYNKKAAYTSTLNAL